MLFEKKIQDINNLQASIDEYNKKKCSLRIEETYNLLNILTKQKLEYVEIQSNIQKEIDSINEYTANQEVNIYLLIFIQYCY